MRVKDQTQDFWGTLATLHGWKRKSFLKAFADESAGFPKELMRILDFRPVGNLIEVWRSAKFLVQVHRDGENLERLSINTTEVNERGDRWRDGITWDTLQRLKRECGRGEFEACEIYPADSDVVNVANIRHLWLFKSGTPLSDLGMVWKAKQ